MKVVIVGGGIAAASAVSGLARVQGAQVTMISETSELVWNHSVLADETRRPIVTTDLEALCASNGSLFVQDKIIAINPKARALKGASGAVYGYDTLLMCTGGGSADRSYSLPGVANTCYSVYESRAMMELRSDLAHMLRLPHKHKLRLLVLGGGLSGVETAANVQAYADKIMDTYYLPRKKVEVELLEKEGRLMPAADRSTSELVRARLEDMGVSVLLKHGVLTLEDHVVATSSGERAADIMVWAAGHSSGSIFGRYPETFELRNGRVVTNNFLSVPKAPEIMVLGDANDRGGFVITAVAHANYATSMIKDLLRGREPKPYVDELAEFGAVLGKKWALFSKNGKVFIGRKAWRLYKKSQKQFFAKSIFK